MNHDKNESVNAKIAEVKEALLARGFKVRLETPGIITLFHPEFYKETYLGTFLNPFSCLEYNEEPGKVYLWADDHGREAATVTITPVYRSNATAKNVNIEIVVAHSHWKLGDHVDKPSDRDLRNEIYVRELKKSPTDLFQGVRHFAQQVDGCRAYRRRLNCNASARLTEKVAGEIEAAVRQFVVRDHSAEERDHRDFHEDTSAAFFAWEDEWKRKHM